MRINTNAQSETDGQSVTELTPIQGNEIFLKLLPIRYGIQAAEYSHHTTCRTPANDLHGCVLSIHLQTLSHKPNRTREYYNFPPYSRNAFNITQEGGINTVLVMATSYFSSHSTDTTRTVSTIDGGWIDHVEILFNEAPRASEPASKSITGEETPLETPGFASILGLVVTSTALPMAKEEGGGFTEEGVSG